LQRSRRSDEADSPVSFHEAALSRHQKPVTGLFVDSKKAGYEGENFVMGFIRWLRRKPMPPGASHFWFTSSTGPTSFVLKINDPGKEFGVLGK
jgi:hypothetical protein